MQDAARKGAFRDPERIKQLHVAQRRAWNRRILDGSGGAGGVMAELHLFSMSQHSATGTEYGGVDRSDGFTPVDSASLRQWDGAETYC